MFNRRRMADLEAVVDQLGASLTAAEKRISALEKPGRDPRSTTGGQVERAIQFDFDRRRPASFGFGRDVRGTNDPGRNQPDRQAAHRSGLPGGPSAPGQAAQACDRG